MKLYVNRSKTAEYPQYKWTDGYGAYLLSLDGVNLDVRGPLNIMSEPVYVPLIQTIDNPKGIAFLFRRRNDELWSVIFTMWKIYFEPIAIQLRPEDEE